MRASLRLALCSAAGAALALPSLPAQSLPPTTVLAAADRRPAVSLDGPWHFIVDPYRNGWGGWPNEPAEPSPHGYIALVHPDPHGPVVEYDWPKEPTLAVPGDWNSQRPELLNYYGLVWYEREFTVHPKAGTRTFLHFGAIDDHANVAVNGTNVCAHTGAYTSFDCDVTAALHDGGNFVVVAVDNTLRRDDVPSTKTDWWNYGGLTGGVSLISVPERFLDDAELHLERGGSERIRGYAHVDGAGAGTPVSLSIPELGVAEQARTDAQGRAAFSFTPRNLQRWSPEMPKLYNVTWKSGADTLQDTVGFRTIEVQGDRILLNGRPVRLNGVSMHAEAPRHWPTWPASQTGRAATDDDARLLLGWVKALGCNYVRFSHYPYPEPFLREADRLGLLVWSEIPVYWSIDWTSPQALGSAQAQLHENIRRDRDRASIIFWSVSNETPPGEERNVFLRRLVAQARAEDPSRLVTSAIVTPFHRDAAGVLTTTLDDPLDGDLDVLGYNEYIGWYQGAPEDAPRAKWSDSSGKPVIVSEFGGGAKLGLHGPPDERWTEEYQANLFRKQWQMIDGLPFVQGTSPWVLMDFRSPVRQLPDIQDGYNRKGLVSADGTHKQAWAVVREQYVSQGGR